MDTDREDLSLAICKPSNLNLNLSRYNRLMNNSSLQPSGWFEIRLFYVRISPCAIGSIPDRLNLRHLRREIGVVLEINGSRVLASDTAVVTLRRDRVDKETSEVTYVSTDSVRVTGAVEFEVHEEEEMVLCGSLERMESNWSNGSVGLEINPNSAGWSLDCYAGAIGNGGAGASSFFQPKLGISSPSIEVYIAGCCSGSPVILTKMILISPRRKPSRHGVLDAIPEDEEIEKEQRNGNGNGSVRLRKMQVMFLLSMNYDDILPYSLFLLINLV